MKLKSKYGSRRAGEYPPIEDQLDMLWHGMDKNPETRVEPFYTKLKQVKDANPKPKI